MASYLVKAEWAVGGRESAYRLAEALHTILGADRAIAEEVPDLPEGFRAFCHRVGCPCRVPGPVCEECMCIKPETGPYCPRCGWHHDKHVTEGGRDGAT